MSSGAWSTQSTVKGNTSDSSSAQECNVNCAKRQPRVVPRAPLEHKEAERCAGVAVKTIVDIMRQLVEDSVINPVDFPGHRLYLQESSFGCARCWQRVSRRCGKDALRSLQDSACEGGKIESEADLPIRGRLRMSHVLERHGAWVECLQCLKSLRGEDGKRLQWLGLERVKAKGQQKLRFGPTSSES